MTYILSVNKTKKQKFFKKLKCTAFFVVCPKSTLLTNQGKHSFDDPLNKLQALKSCPGTKVASVLVFSTGVLQRILHWPPQAEKKEEASRESVPFEIAHGVLLGDIWRWNKCRAIMGIVGEFSAL